MPDKIALFALLCCHLPDDFKMVVVEAIRALCLKFPAKHRSLMNFLSNILREEGGFDYKKSIVTAILALIQVQVQCTAGMLNVACTTARWVLHAQA